MLPRRPSCVGGEDGGGRLGPVGLGQRLEAAQFVAEHEPHKRDPVQLG